MQTSPQLTTHGLITKVGMLTLVDTICQSGNPDEPFFYLGGPMSNIPQFNFPEFQRVGTLLREQGYNIVSPAELDDPATAEAALASPDGRAHLNGQKVAGWSWSDFLSRDLIVCALPKCIGGIFLEGWEKSRGALLESHVLDALGKPLYVYFDTEGGPVLQSIDRAEHLAAVEYAQKQIAEATANEEVRGQLSLEEALAELEPQEKF